MGAVLPTHVRLIHQANIGLVDQRGGLKGVAFPFTIHETAREPVKLVVDEWVQLVERFLITTTPFDE
jgi:hypothetical protein